MHLRLRIVTISLVALLLFCPIGLYATGVLPALLGGKEEIIVPVRFSLANVLSQKFQSYFERYFQRNSALFPVLLKTDNQLDYFLFGMASSNPKSTVVLGKQDVLIEKLYIENANRASSVNASKLTEVANRLKKLQSRLKKAGVPFIFLISPNKPSFSPEIIPTRYRKPGVETRLDPRAVLLAQLRARNVNVLDGFEFLKQKQAEYRQPMFPKLGTHWSELGGCLVASEILRLGAELSGAAFRQRRCIVSGMQPEPGFYDLDLLRLADFWFPKLLIDPAPQVLAVPLAKPDSIKPKILIVGSSFCWELLRQFERTDSSHIDFLYYFHRRTAMASDRGRNFDKQKFDVAKQVLNQDLVVIEINQAVLERAGFGFIQKVLEQTR